MEFGPFSGCTDKLNRSKILRIRRVWVGLLIRSGWKRNRSDRLTFGPIRFVASQSSMSFPRFNSDSFIFSLLSCSQRRLNTIRNRVGQQLSRGLSRTVWPITTPIRVWWKWSRSRNATGYQHKRSIRLKRFCWGIWIGWKTVRRTCSSLVSCLTFSSQLGFIPTTATHSTWLQKVFSWIR